MVSFKSLISLLPFLASTNAYFILTQPVLEVTRLDPVVSPGVVSSHVHTIAGGSNFDKTMTYAGMRQGTCTTAPVTVDLSNYWIPQLYYYNPTAQTFQAIPAQFMNAYYLPRPGASGVVQAFPDGLRMISGNPNRRTFDPSSVPDQAISYVCLDTGNSHANDPDWAQRNNFFDHNCPAGMRAQVNFPSCWDGVNLDSSDHSSHMAFADGGVNGGGECPSSHPVHLVSLFYEFIFEVQNFPYNNGSQPTWVWANGDTTGYGLHADFINGWPSLINGSNVLQDAINQCNADNGVGGELQNCPPLVPYLNSAASGACRPQNALVSEDVGMGHPITLLPGNNPLWIGNGSKPTIPGYVEGNTTYTNPNSVIPTGYTDVGCVAEGTSGRALTGASFSGPSMTRGVCVSYCQKLGFPLAGVEYGSECYCDVQMRNGASNTTILPSTSCGMSCANNTYENCGGSATLELFNNPSMYASIAASLSVIPKGYSDVGCIAEGPSGRALTGASFTSNNMTRGACVSWCQSFGFPLAGVEYSSQCFCDSQMRNGASNTTLLDPSQCGYTCANNTYEKCGGAATLELFVNPALFPAPAAITVTPSNSTIPAGYVDTGCIAEASSGRALTGKQWFDAGMTRGACVSYCSSFGYPLAGVEYSSQCFCDSQLRNGATNTTLLDWSKCSMKCANNANEFCGGPGTLELFTNPSMFKTPVALPAGWSSYGCMTEAANMRALSGYAFTSSSMTQALCINTCASKGFKYAGAEYAGECYCGNSFNAGSVAAPATDCNMACNGDINGVCGGGNRLTTFVSSVVTISSASSSSSGASSSSSSASASASVSKSSSSSSSSSSTPTSSSASVSVSKSSSATSSSSTPSSSSPSSPSSSSTSSSPSASASAKSYIGCFSDASARMLNGTTTASSAMTNQFCSSFCASQGYPYAGTEWAQQCWCGKYLNKASQIAATSCDTSCTGDNTQKCGSGMVLSVYSTGSGTGVAYGTTPAAFGKRSKSRL